MEEYLRLMTQSRTSAMTVKLNKLIHRIKNETSTDYTEAIIDGLILAIKLDKGEVSIENALKQILEKSKQFVESRRDM